MSTVLSFIFASTPPSLLLPSLPSSLRTCVSCCGSSTSPHFISSCPCATNQDAVACHNRTPVGIRPSLPPSLPPSLSEEEVEKEKEGVRQSIWDRSLLARAASPREEALRPAAAGPVSSQPVV